MVFDDDVLTRDQPIFDKPSLELLDLTRVQRRRD
jgi:hypothetical protein